MSVLAITYTGPRPRTDKNAKPGDMKAPFVEITHVATGARLRVRSTAQAEILALLDEHNRERVAKACAELPATSGPDEVF